MLGRIYGDGDRDGRMERLVEGVVRRVEREILEEEGGSEGMKRGWRGKLGHLGHGFRELVGVGANWRALVIACMLQGFQQLCGFVSFPFFPSFSLTSTVLSAPKSIFLHAPSFASSILPKLISSATANSGT